MPDARRRLSKATLIYWMLLLYIIAALIWWFISLEKQNQQKANLQYENILISGRNLKTEDFLNKVNAINSESKRNTAKYVAEGITFLILILIGAGFVYRSVRRQLITQQQQQNFMMAVTHELKTPVSVARLNLETMQKYALEPEKQKKLIKMTLEETDRLTFLTNNILVSSQLDGGGYQKTKDELDLSTLLKDCIQDFRNRCPERPFPEEITPDADLKGDPLLLQMLINNLLENAIKYSPKDTAILSRLTKTPNHIILEIIDEGPGIDEEEKKKIFSKFYRIGNEATRKTQGTGLGLYLCSKIAKDHNADILVTNHLPHGSNFTVRFKV